MEYKKLSGWVICRLKSEFDLDEETKSSGTASNESILNKICDLVYGVLSEDMFPPLDDWVFLANGELSCFVSISTRTCTYLLILPP